MKLNKIIQTSLHRWLCALVLLFVGFAYAMASNDYFYSTTVSSLPLAAGKVYVDTQSKESPDYVDESMTKTGKQHTIGYGEYTFFYYAQPVNENYIFSHWTDEEGNQVGTQGQTSYSVTKTFRSQDSNKPTTFNYTAVFVAQTGLIKVKNTDESKGSVAISNAENTEGDEVTLTAYPDVSNGVMFYGWKKDGTGDYVSTKTEFTLEANSETSGTYYAYFSDAAEKVYIRLKNRKTKKFLSICGKNPASTHTRDYSSYKNIKDGFKLDGSLKMISAADAQGNPSSVFMRTGHAQGTGTTVGVDLVAHGVSYANLVGADASTGQYMLNIENSGTYVRLYTTYTLKVNGRTLDLPSYLCDEGGDYAVMKTIQGLDNDVAESAEWELYALDESTTKGAFGANTKAKYTKDGMYYTTMYTDFAYKLLDGVNAYYLVFNENFTEITDRIVFTKVEGDIVPANTAVILECKNVQNDASQEGTVTNRLMPLANDNTTITIYNGQTLTPGLNMLKGYCSVKDKPVVNNKKSMYVLSTNKQGVLGFHPFSKSNMTANKAYLDTRVEDEKVTEEYAKKLTFSFGDPEDTSEDQNPTGIQISEQVVDDDGSTPVYDLNGSKVAVGKTAENMLRPGVYVKKGKKFVVK